MKRLLASFLMSSLAAGWATTAWSADNATTNDAQKSKVLVATAFRASALTRLNVRNMQGEKLGTVNDLVVDVRTGKVAYAALSVGGLLSVGNKMFAVPFGELKFDHGMDEMFFVLNLSKEKLEAAPGFDQSDWPNFADPHWSERIDKYYREARAKAEARTSTTRSVE
ncbi:MAG: PRC-barrel domain-containing protein [Pirellulales bacterium]